VPIVDHHDRIFSREGCHAALVGDLVGFHASGERSRSHEILHHAAVHELVLDEVGIVWARLPKELLKVVRGWPCLTRAATRSCPNVHHAGAVCSLTVAAVIISRGYDLLKSLLAPLPITLGAYPASWVVAAADASLLLLEVGRGWAASLLAAYWAAMVRSSQVVFPMASAGAWKG
jgi:hypothetical protein